MTNLNRGELNAVEHALESVLTARPLKFQIGSQQLSLKQCWLYFREYTGPSPENSLGKPIVGTPDRPFAELQAVRRLERQGWTAGWLSGPRKFISAWEPPEEARPHPTARELMERIDARAAGNASCWDVFAWKRRRRFIHMMRAGSAESLPLAKQRWLEAALAEGVPPTTFEIWRWFGGALDGRVLRLTNYTWDRLVGWAEWEDGHVTYSGHIRGMVDSYRDWGAQTEADLLWLVFVRNSDGVTWCGIEEREATQLRLAL